MKKLVVFATDTKFLGWSRRFDTKIFNPATSATGLRFIMKRLMMPRNIVSLSKWADVVFADFLTPLAKKVINKSTKPVYVRIHRYELDYPESFSNVNWENVKGVIGVSEHYGNLLREFVPKEVPITVIPPGVDAERWPFHPSDSGKLCTWAIPTHRKRIYDLMLALKGYELHLGGYSANDRILVDRNVRWNLGHVIEPDIKFPEWLWDKEIYIHHALDESFGVAIGEAMLAGLIPLSHRLPCVLEFLPSELTYVYNSELVDLIEKVRAMDLDERNKLKQELKEIILSKYTSIYTGNQMEKLFLKDLEQ